MKRAVFLSMVLIFILTLTGCGKKADPMNLPEVKDILTESGDEMKENTYEHISQEDAKALMDSETDYMILDVRTQEEYDGGHIPGAICIPNEDIDDSVSELLPDQEQLLLVYCRSGNRSKKASEKLAALGYTNVKEFGGINTWPYETE